MKMVFKIFNKKIPQSDEYIEVEAGREEKEQKLTIRPFVLKNFEDTVPILEAIREGNTIGLIDIKPLRQRDIVELKKAISKLKKTVDALQGNIFGFGENTVVITPNEVSVFRAQVEQK